MGILALGNNKKNERRNKGGGATAAETHRCEARHASFLLLLCIPDFELVKVHFPIGVIVCDGDSQQHPLTAELRASKDKPMDTQTCWGRGGEGRGGGGSNDGCGDGGGDGGDEEDAAERKE